jgi:deoxyribodipyrimidine photo-lyase
MSSTVQPERVHVLNDNEPRGDAKYCLYWMEKSLRTVANPALEYAVEQANARKVPLLVAVVVSDNRVLNDFNQEVTARQLHFLIEGLEDVRQDLERRKIGFVALLGDPMREIPRLAKDAATVVCDFGYLRHQRKWRQQLASKLDPPLTAVEADLIVPVETASDHQEYAARTLRPKIESRLNDFLCEVSTVKVQHPFRGIDIDCLDISDPAAVVDRCETEDVPPVPDLFRGGQRAANQWLEDFLSDHLYQYDDNRNQPDTDGVSHLSKYLHFGNISPVQVAMRVNSKRGQKREDKDSFLEELTVRRELTHNFVYYCDRYDSYQSMPEWARETLADHRDDKREVHFTHSELENAETDDPYWNAAMNQLRHTGYMHNYMRMYWGKQILNWAYTPEDAYATALRLNNRYFLDGNDSNSFANIGWIFGLHDRAWAEREIFGKVRYMNRSGLESKCDADGYVRKVEELVARVQ